MQPIVVRERFGADQTLEEVTHRVTIRYRPDVASGMRFVMGDRVLSILTVHDSDETGRYLICRTREQGR
ncbi:MAG: phage head closure protein [Mesorhizobium sp.]|nr:phage head closure protein [Mesorhizobium sp.]